MNSLEQYLADAPRDYAAMANELGRLVDFNTFRAGGEIPSFTRFDGALGSVSIPKESK
jgi:hypothetical protein